MSIKINIKPKKKADESDDFSAIPSIVGKLNAVSKLINSTLVMRSREVDAMMLALICRRHVLFEGLHGVAKSNIAHLLFQCLSDAKVYDIQFSKATQADELFGPLDAKKYRDDATWFRNTTGMLPEADIALLDEFHRAPDMLLSSLMRVMNEGYYMNGPLRVKCPLHTAIGTTNFIPTLDELAAINDRWLVRVKVTPLDLTDLGARVAMLRASYDQDIQATIGSVKQSTPKLTMKELGTLYKFVRQLNLPLEVYKVYASLVSEFQRGLQRADASSYVSDRRITHAFELAKALFVLKEPKKAINGAPMPLTSLFAASFALADLYPRGSDVFASTYNTVIEVRIKQEQENEFFRSVDDTVNSILASFDTSLPSPRLFKMGKDLRILKNGLNNLPPDRTPTFPDNVQLCQEVLSKIESLLTSIGEVLVNRSQI